MRKGTTPPTPTAAEDFGHAVQVYTKAGKEGRITSLKLLLVPECLAGCSLSLLAFGQGLCNPSFGQGAANTKHKHTDIGPKT